MPLPSILTFNELNGEEVREILENRCHQVFERVPQFQRHITLPRVKITLSVKLEIWADQPHPEQIQIGDSLTVVLDEPQLVDTITAEAVDNAAPVPGGSPPDKIREMHGLAIAAPARGPNEVGGQIAISDQLVPSGAPAELPPGVTISREGGATVVQLDQGPAGLGQGFMNRERMTWKQQGKPERKLR